MLVSEVMLVGLVGSLAAVGAGAVACFHFEGGVQSGVGKAHRPIEAAQGEPW